MWSIFTMYLIRFKIHSNPWGTPIDQIIALYMTVTVAPHIGKFIKNRFNVFERGGNFLQNGILHFLIKFSQLPEIALES